MHRWWDGDRDERYWVEVTERSDVGADLNAPEFNEQGQPQWSYDLLREPDEGDVVFHFNKNAEAITSYSYVVGAAWPDEVVWGAKGTSARGNDVTPYGRPGWRRGLRAFTRIPPVTLADVRAVEPQVLALRDRLTAANGTPLYFPFVPYKGQPLRTFQGYFMKMPRELVELLGLPTDQQSGERAADDKPLPSPPAARVGTDYREADESVAVATADPMERDPAVVERALQSHRATQNAVAAWVRSQGLTPLSPKPTDPDWDVAWDTPEALYVTEVKSITPRNEERQLRLAVGQVLRYRQRLSAGRPVVAMIATSHRPTDDSWEVLCESLDIRLWWPGRP